MAIEVRASGAIAAEALAQHGELADLPGAVVPCDTCGQPTTMLGTRRCDPCWEVEKRLRDYLKSRNGRVRALDLMAKIHASELLDGGKLDTEGA